MTLRVSRKTGFTETQGRRLLPSQKDKFCPIAEIQIQIEIAGVRYCLISGDNSLRLAEDAGLGTRDLKRIEVVGLSIKDAHINFGPGAVGKKMSELKA